MRLLKATLLVLIVYSGLVLAADTWEAPKKATERKNPLDGNIASINSGKNVYKNNCVSCHGEKGKGDGPSAEALEKPPVNFSKKEVQDQTDGALFWKITEGRKPMPSFVKTLSEEERWQVVNFIRTFATKK